MDPLVRGLVALALSGTLFIAARLRFRAKDNDDDAPADVELD